MKELIGHKCKLVVSYQGNFLYFTADVKQVTDTHISFIDKYGEYYTLKITDIKQVKLIKEEEVEHG